MPIFEGTGLIEAYLSGIEAALLRINDTLAENVEALREQAKALRASLDSQSQKGGDST